MQLMFINNCALMESRMQFISKYEHRPFPDSNEIQVSVSTFEDHRPERANLAVVHYSPSIGAGPGIALFRKLQGAIRQGFVLESCH